MEELLNEISEARLRYSEDSGPLAQTIDTITRKYRARLDEGKRSLFRDEDAA